MPTTTLNMLFYIFVCTLLTSTCVSVKHEVHIVLGSANENILKERVGAAINYINKTNNPNIFLVVFWPKAAL